MTYTLQKKEGEEQSKGNGSVARLVPTPDVVAKYAEYVLNVALWTAVVWLSFSLVFGDTSIEVDATAMRDVLGKMINIVGLVFQVVGVILAIYAAGSLVLAFKNEDANSKTNATTLLVIGIILLSMPTLLNGLNLTGYIGNGVDGVDAEIE